MDIPNELTVKDSYKSNISHNRDKKISRTDVKKALQNKKQEDNLT